MLDSLRDILTTAALKHKFIRLADLPGDLDNLRQGVNELGFTIVHQWNEEIVLLESSTSTEVKS